MDTIFTRQNEQQNIELLCAQKQLYIEAKKILLLQILLTCPFVFVLATLKLVLANVYDFSAIALVCSSLIGLADILIMVFVINDYKKKAAKTQEAFDCAVYGLSWNKNFVGSRNPKELINKHCSRFTEAGGKIEKLIDWYPIELAKFSGFIVILHCQKMNLIYDIDIRTKYKLYANWIAYTPLVLLLIIAVIMKLPADKLLLLVATFWPIIMLAIKTAIDHNKAINYSEETKGLIDGLLNDRENITEQDVKDIQKRIYTNRKDGPLIPEQFYYWIRDKLEKEMHDNAQKA